MLKLAKFILTQSRKVAKTRSALLRDVGFIPAALFRPFRALSITKSITWGAAPG